jgi:two-component system, chemotaxis family, chemotaxis protein CheY
MPRNPRKGAILIIDDDADVRSALRDTLEDEGYEVAEAAGGNAALAYLRSHPAPVIIFLDWNMAPMNAPQFMDEFSKEPGLSQVPVVLITADTHANQKVETGRYRDLLTKPLDLDQLFSIIGRLAPG